MENPRLGCRFIHLEDGGTLFFYTDGLIENSNAGGRLMRASSLKKLLIQNPGESPAVKVTRVVNHARKIWADHPMDDDCCVMAVGFKKAG